MKWLLLSCFLLWARHGEGGALKCLPGDEECLTQSDEVEQQELDIRRPQGSTDAPAECLSGSEWESNCHRCRCLDGEAQCLRQLGCDSIDEPIRCAPNTTFERECNTCVCLETGLGLCTVNPCEEVPTEAPSTQLVPRGVECAPGSAWQSRCNDCVCSPGGRRRCTERACPGRETEAELRCAPQSQWKNDCNMCWCNNGRAVCTKMGCLGLPGDLNFDTEDADGDSKEIPEPNKSHKVPDVSKNVLESNEDRYMSEKLEDLGASPDEVNQTDKNLKDLEDLDHNDVDEPIQVPDKVMFEFAANAGSKVRDQDVELLEDLLSHEDNNVEGYDSPNDSGTNNDAEVDAQNQAADDSENSVFANEEGMNNQDENEEDKQNTEGDKDIEELDTSYFNLNGQSTHRIQKRSTCKPNQEFQNECNTCTCSANGDSYTCTQNECMDRDKEEVDKGVDVFMENEGTDHVEKHSVCKPSSTFYMGCNPCHCNSVGSDFTCSNKPCPLPEDVEVFHELHILKSTKNATKKVCVENRMFIMNCNTCWCNEDGTSYFCTRRVCVNEKEPVVEEGKPEPNLRIVERECKPGEVFEVACNMCRCNDDGKTFSCTRRACVDADAKNQTVSRKTRATPQEPLKACLPGQEFRLDCNKCLCDDVGQDFSCTRIDCAALNNNNNNNGARRKRDVSQKVPAECVPGSVFDQDCNVCRCTEDGGHATCSLKRCPSKENSTLTATDSSSSFRCNPGEQFKRSCNDCSCAADGKSVFCTLLVCDDELSP